MNNANLNQVLQTNMYIVHPPSLMNKSFYTRTPLSKRGTNSILAWNNLHFSNQSERVWILTCSMYKSLNCVQILCGKRWKSVEIARPDLPEAGSRWYYLFLFSFFAKGGKGLKQVGRMYLRPIVDDSICTALPTRPQTNRPQGGAGASSSQLDSGFENKICSQSLIQPKIWKVGERRSGMCSKYSQVKGISPVCVLAK